jgi:hypothetical protein
MHACIALTVNPTHPAPTWKLITQTQTRYSKAAAKTLAAAAAAFAAFSSAACFALANFLAAFLEMGCEDTTREKPDERGERDERQRARSQQCHLLHGSPRAWGFPVRSAGFRTFIWLLPVVAAASGSRPLTKPLRVALLCNGSAFRWRCRAPNAPALAVASGNHATLAALTTPQREQGRERDRPCTGAPRLDARPAKPAKPAGEV